MAARNQPLTAPFTQQTTEATPAPAPAPKPEDFTFEVSGYVVGKHRAISKVPDQVADLLEELRSAHGRDVKDAKGAIIGAGTVKFRTVTVAHEAAGDDFMKHVRSYSKTVMYPEWSARVSRLSPTTFRVGVGPVKPKPRRAKTADVPDTEAGVIPAE